MKETKSENKSDKEIIITIIIMTTLFLTFPNTMDDDEIERFITLMLSKSKEERYDLKYEVKKTKREYDDMDCEEENKRIRM